MSCQFGDERRVMYPGPEEKHEEERRERRKRRGERGGRGEEGGKVGLAKHQVDLDQMTY